VKNGQMFGFCTNFLAASLPKKLTLCIFFCFLLGFAPQKTKKTHKTLFSAAFGGRKKSTKKAAPIITIRAAFEIYF